MAKRKKWTYLQSTHVLRSDDFSKNFQTSLAPPLGLCALRCVLWGPARGDWEPDRDWEPDWECKSNFSSSIITSSSVSDELLVLDGRVESVEFNGARCGVGDGGGYWFKLAVSGAEPWYCLRARGVNKTAAAARFWESWMRREAKDTVDLTGVIGSNGSTPSLCFEGFQMRPEAWGSRGFLKKGYMYNVPYVLENSGLTVAERNFHYLTRI